MSKYFGKKLLCFALALLMVFSTAAMCAAEQAKDENFRNNASFIQDYRTLEGQLLVYCAGLDMYGLSSAAVSASLNNEAIPIVGASISEEEPVTYYCLVDVSGSITKQQMDSAKKALRALRDCLGSDDRMLIAKLGDTIESSGYLTNRDRILDEINELKVTTQDTNLYRGIADVLQELDTTSKTLGRKCLVVFSDGCDDSSVETGRTLEEAQRKITETRIPVYTVAAPGIGKEAGKVMGSLARLSVGGVAFTYENTDMDENKVGEGIAADMHNDLMLLLDLTDFSPKGDELLLAVSYKGGDDTAYGDAITVYTKNLILVEPTPAPVPTSEPVPTKEPIQTPEIEVELHWWEKIPTWLIILVAVLLALLVALVVILLVVGKKRKEKEQQASDDHVTDDVTDYVTGSWGNDDETGWDVDDFRHDDKRYHGGVRPTVRFTSVGKDSYSVALGLEEGRDTVLGRDNRADLILNPGDRSLSGEQCVVRLEGKTLIVRDANSRNGTSVNGVQIKQNYVKMREGDTLGVGSLTYRIQFL